MKKPYLLLHLLFTSTLLTLLLNIPLSTSSLLDIGIGIGIGGGGGGTGISIGFGGGVSATKHPPPPTESCGCTAAAPKPPPPPPQPSDFLNLKQYEVYVVIQRFKRTITSDPTNATATWIGHRPCTYSGFYCARPPDSPDTTTVFSVDFNGFRLRAPSLFGFVDSLPDLSLFHANTNFFSGSLPNLSGLRYLYELDLSNNLLTGEFPSSNLLPLKTLTFLDLRFNNFSGELSAGILTLNVDVLFLNNNGLSGELSPEFGSSPAAYITLANNRLTGEIPGSICNSSNTLIEVLFLGNQLSGCLPYQLGQLNRATVVDAGSNRITGPVPHALGCLNLVEQLNLAGNLLYGGVPDPICWLYASGRLKNLSLSDNYFTSLGLSCWSLLKPGILDVRRNCIVGLPDQRSPEECAEFLVRQRLWVCPRSFIPCTLQYPQSLKTPPPPTTTTSPESLEEMDGRATERRYVTYSVLTSRRDHGQTKN